jgi:hypothetical protein
VIVAARDNYPRRKGRGLLRLHDLADQVWILNPPGCGCRAALQRAFDRTGAPMGIATEVFGEELQLSLIARGSGLGLVPKRQLDSSPHRRELRIVKTTDFNLQAMITMLHGPSLGRLADAVNYLRDTISVRPQASRIRRKKPPTNSLIDRKRCAVSLHRINLPRHLEGRSRAAQRYAHGTLSPKADNQRRLLASIAGLADVEMLLRHGRMDNLLKAHS